MALWGINVMRLKVILLAQCMAYGRAFGRRPETAVASSLMSPYSLEPSDLL